MIFYYYLNSEKAKLILISFSLTGLWDLWTVSPGWTFHPDTPSSSAHSPPHPFLEHDKDTHLSLRHCESEWKKEGRLSGADTKAQPGRQLYLLQVICLPTIRTRLYIFLPELSPSSETEEVSESSSSELEASCSCSSTSISSAVVSFFSRSRCTGMSAR